jgi:hypothetical protein
LHRASRRVELPPSQYLYFCTSSVRPSA